MQSKVDHYGATYGQFSDAVYSRIRRETFGTDIGQTGWLTLDEHDLFLSWLQLARGRSLLDVACGSGGPTLRATLNTQCTVHGIDLREDAIRTAKSMARDANVEDRAGFQQVDAAGLLPFADCSFDAIVCVDAINHFADRPLVISEWRRVLTPGGRIVFTNPIVITGAISNEEITIRSSIGYFLFTPPGYDESILEHCGLTLVSRVDRTENTARVARRWHDARSGHASELRRIEGQDTFEGQQRFLDVASGLAATGRLSRIAFLAEKPPIC